MSLVFCLVNVRIVWKSTKRMKELEMGTLFFLVGHPLLGAHGPSSPSLPVPAGTTAREELPVQLGCPVEVHYGTGLKDTITDELHRMVPHLGHGIDSAHSLSIYSVDFLHHFLAGEGVADPLIPTSYSDTALKRVINFLGGFFAVIQHDSILNALKILMGLFS